MANWIEKIELNKAINIATEQYDLSRHEEPCPNEVKELIIAELNRSQILRRFAISVKKVKSIAALNRLLVQIYDEADYRKVWCGLN